MTLIYGTCVAIDGAGVLLRGPSGSGKSDLALRLIEDGATLVADDQVAIENRDDVALATAPEAIAGRLEVRGVGVVALPHGPAPLKLIVDLVDRTDVPRLPNATSEDVGGIDVPVLALAPFEASTPAKVRHALILLTL